MGLFVTALCFLFRLATLHSYRYLYWHTDRHVAKGGSEGVDEPPFFSDQKKKVDGVRVWQLRVPGVIAPACTAVGLRIHGPEPNLESVAV